MAPWVQGYCGHVQPVGQLCAPGLSTKPLGQAEVLGPEGISKGTRISNRFLFEITHCFAENTAVMPVLKLQFPTSLSLTCLK